MTGRTGKRRGRAAGVTAALVAGVLALPASAQASARDEATPPPGAVGPVVTHPVEQSFSYPAGEVCAFPSHTEFPVSDLTLTTWTDGDGQPLFAVESGPLVMTVTNLETGESVTRDIGGTGVIDYFDDGSYTLTGNDWAAPFRSGDSPHNTWLVARDFMSVKLTPDGEGGHRHTLLAAAGRVEDLCETLG